MTEGRGRRVSPGGHRRGAVPPRAWFQLAFLIAALVVLLLFMTQIGQRSAGCFQQLTTAGADAAAAPGNPPETPAPTPPAP